MHVVIPAEGHFCSIKKYVLLASIKYKHAQDKVEDYCCIEKIGLIEGRNKR